jgi:signal transduction histidine kinase/PAS domain-containing protein
MTKKLDQVRTSVILFSDCKAYCRRFTQSILDYCPHTTIVHAQSCDQIETLLKTMKVDILFVDARMADVTDRLTSCGSGHIKSLIALIDNDVSAMVQHRLVDLGVDGFVSAEHFLTIALRLKEFWRLDMAREMVGEYDSMLRGQVSELFLLHKIVDDAAIMMATLDADFAVMTANDSFSQLCGDNHPRGKLLGSLLPEAPFEQEIKPALQRALCGESVCIQSLAALSSQISFVQLYCHPLYDFDERIQGIALVLNDISQLKLVKQRYQEMSREFTTLLNGISDAITLIRLDGSIAWGNQASRTVLTIALDQSPALRCCLNNSNQSCLNGGRSQGGNDCLVRRCLDSGEKQRELLKASDGRSLGVKVFPLLDDHQRVSGAIRIVSDVTEAVQLKKEADQTSRLAALGELAAGVAHEINNPNGLLALNNSLLQEICQDMMAELSELECRDGSYGGFSFADLEQELPQLFQNNHQATTNIRRIVEDLKQFTRREQERFELVDVNEVILAASRMVTSSLKKASCHVRILYGDELPRFRASFQSLQQVVINLLMNACQALTNSEQFIEVRSDFDAERGLISIAVIDGGRGISPDHLDKIFDPFFTTKREEGGTGLGLSVSSRIIKEHGGTFHYDSTPGEGTRVTVLLPVGESE